MYDNDVYLSNIEPTDLIFLQSCRLILIWFRRPGVSRGIIGSKLWITFKSKEPPGSKSAHSLRRPILPVVIPWPTKGRPRESTGPKPFARPSCLLVDPGISVPHRHGCSNFFEEVWCLIGMLALHGGEKFGICPFLVLLILFGMVGGASVGGLLPLPLALKGSKITHTTSSPEAWLMVMSISSSVVLGCLHPSLWTRDSQVVSKKKATIMLAGDLMHC
jgi:hypothetical protein